MINILKCKKNVCEVKNRFKFRIQTKHLAIMRKDKESKMWKCYKWHIHYSKFKMNEYSINSHSKFSYLERSDSPFVDVISSHRSMLCNSFFGFMSLSWVCLDSVSVRHATYVTLRHLHQSICLAFFALSVWLLAISYHMCLRSRNCI